jgi:hypothetical protein
MTPSQTKCNQAVCIACAKRCEWRCSVSGKLIAHHFGSGDCPKMRFASRGLGDTIAKITTAIGVQKCSGCSERQAALNKIVPFK